MMSMLGIEEYDTLNGCRSFSWYSSCLVGYSTLERADG
jgi:hypothetical protein